MKLGERLACYGRPQYNCNVQGSRGRGDAGEQTRSARLARCSRTERKTIEKNYVQVYYVPVIVRERAGAIVQDESLVLEGAQPRLDDRHRHEMVTRAANDVERDFMARRGRRRSVAHCTRCARRAQRRTARRRGSGGGTNGGSMSGGSMSAALCAAKRSALAAERLMSFAVAFSPPLLPRSCAQNRRRRESTSRAGEDRFTTVGRQCRKSASVAVRREAAEPHD